MSLELITKTAETRFVQALSQHEAEANWVVVNFNLSMLLDEYKSEYQFKIAVNLIHDLLKNYEGFIYAMADNSIVVLCHKLEKLLLDKLIFQLRYLYMDDPLCYDDKGEENPEFCSVYDVRLDWKALEALSVRYVKMVTRKSMLKPEPEMAVRAEPVAPPPIRKITSDRMPKLISDEPLDIIPVRAEALKPYTPPDKLAALRQALSVMDMKPVTRRQPVCAVLPDMRVRRVFDELYMNIAHLRKLLSSDAEFFTNRWLFQYITHLLDVRMIDMIINTQDEYFSAPISVNLNVETLLSSAFEKFDSSIAAAKKVSVVIEVPVVDLFSDMHAFKAAIKEVKKRGYRVCLDGLSSESFMSIDREKIGLDLIKVQWNADLVSDITSRENEELKKAIHMAGTNRIILCRCDNKSALEYGIAIGISLFQGRYLDSVLNPTSKIEN
jgi:EAL domain-containing protein (putative c-di-GMP-specific phosphodiesterase class I)